jgi:hypothetical protein
MLKATDNMKVGMAQASIERNHAVQQVMRLKQELDQAYRDRHAVSGCVTITLFMLQYFRLIGLCWVCINMTLHLININVRNLPV